MSNLQSTCKKGVPWENVQVQQTESIPLELQIIDQSPGDVKIHTLQLWKEFKEGIETVRQVEDLFDMWCVH